MEHIGENEDRSGRSKDLEIIVLRHQLTVLGRHHNRPALTDKDRTLLGAIAAAVPRPHRPGWIVTPDALLRWHRRHRPALVPTTPTARTARHHRRDPPAHHSAGVAEPNLGLPTHPRRTRRSRPLHCLLDGVADPSRPAASTQPPTDPTSPGRSSCTPRQRSPATSSPSTPPCSAGSTPHQPSASPSPDSA